MWRFGRTYTSTVTRNIGWGAQDSNLGMAESKSEISAHSEKNSKADLLGSLSI